MPQFVWFLSFSSHIFAFLHMNINISYNDWSPLPILWLCLWASAALLPNQTLHPALPLAKKGRKGSWPSLPPLPTSHSPSRKERALAATDQEIHFHPPFVAKDWTTCGKEGTKYCDDRIIFWTLGVDSELKRILDCFDCATGSSSNWTNTIYS